MINSLLPGRFATSASSLTREQLTAILEVAKGNPSLVDLHDAILISSSTGVRLGELSEMLWDNINLEAGVFVVASGKFGPRILPMFPGVCEMFARRLAAPSNGSMYLFGSEPEETRMRLLRQFRCLCKRLGMSWVRFRMLRLACCYQLADAGINAETITKLMGCSLDTIVGILGQQQFGLATNAGPAAQTSNGPNR